MKQLSRHVTFIDRIVNGPPETVADGQVPTLSPEGGQGFSNKGLVEMWSNLQANHACHHGGWPVHGKPQKSVKCHSCTHAQN